MRRGWLNKTSILWNLVGYCALSHIIIIVHKINSFMIFPWFCKTLKFSSSPSNDSRFPYSSLNAFYVRPTFSQYVGPFWRLFLRWSVSLPFDSLDFGRVRGYYNLFFYMHGSKLFLLVLMSADNPPSDMRK